MKLWTNEGFMSDIVAACLTSLIAEETRTFKSLKTHQKKVEFMYKLPYIKSLQIPSNIRSRSKDLKRSIANREAGNASFQSGQFKEAILFYSISIISAPQDSKTVNGVRTHVGTTVDLSLAYANRSAALQKIRYFDLALQDIELAMVNGYPKDKQYKVLERKGQCLLQKKSFVAALEAFREALGLVEISALNPKQKAKFIDNVNAEMREAAANTEEGVHEEEKEVENIDCLEIAYTPTQGRFVVASRDIPVGSTILLETPVTQHLTETRRGTNCQECFRLVQAAIPCPWCSEVNFCSVKCRDTAIQSYHKYECSIFKVLTDAGFSVITLMALRIITRFGLDHLLSLEGELRAGPDRLWAVTKSSCVIPKNVNANVNVFDPKEGDDNAADNNNESVYSSHDFVNAFHRFEASEAPAPSRDWLIRSTIAVFLLKCLQSAKFFPNRSEKGLLLINPPTTPQQKLQLHHLSVEPTDDQLTWEESYIGALLLHFISTLPANAHDIGEIEQITRSTLQGSQMKSLGGGLFNTLSLFNHSCEPCFMRGNVGKQVVAIAVKNIAKGEEITENYGLSYPQDIRSRRQDILKNHYGFDCRCRACEEKWPLGVDLKTVQMPVMRCQGCKEGRIDDRISFCPKCDRTVDLVDLKDWRQRMQESSNKVVELLDEAKWREGIEEMKRCHELVAKYAHLPNYYYYLTQNAVWEYIWRVEGNKRVKKIV